MTKAKIRTNVQISNDYYLLELDGSKIINKIKAGQFLNLSIAKENTYDPLLRRPLSIHDTDEDKKSVYLLYKIVGRGTKILSKYKNNNFIDILGPLGSGFTTDFSNKNILVLGGGMGCAPLYFLSKKLKDRNNVSVLIGGNNEDEIRYFQKSYNKISTNVLVATLDGSLGCKGNVIDLWKKYNKFSYDYIYTCGPLAMIKKVQDIVKKFKLKGEVSLEEKMGCGVGLCLSCVCKTKEGNQRICTEGPVFNIEKVVFDLE